MKRLAAALILALCFTQPAAAQTASERQAVLQIQALIAEVGRWAQSYQVAVNLGSQPLNDIQAYLQILDRFDAGEIRASEARTEIEAWRARSLATVQDARRAAAALAPPPALTSLGAEGANLERALRGMHENAVPLIAEFERVIIACADLGLESLSDNSKGLQTRQRALLNAQMQLVRVDLNRVRLSTASLAPTHPTRHLSVATEHYYGALMAVAAHALAVLDGGGDRAALVVSMRRSAADMRASLERSSAFTEQMRGQLQSQLGGPAVEIARTGLQMMDTLPPSIRAFNSLADNIDRAAAAIERGEDVLVVWGDQEEWDMPYLNEIDRLDRVRAGLLANNAGTL